MKIVLFHPTLLPPKDYGGVERVVLWLAKGLIEAGHDVWIGAYRGSVLPTGVQLLEVDPSDPSAVGLRSRIPSGVDLVHFMAPPEKEIHDEFPCPWLLTVHGNGKTGETFPLNTVFLSENHARRHGGNVFVYNGIDPAEYRFEPESKEDSFLFLSKTSWKVKNVRGAMSLCAAAGVPLKIAGGNLPLVPRIEAFLRPGFNWVGPVAAEKKATLLARAKALVFPVIWHEPFGLVVAEALMSGTPVLAPSLGSLPELVATGTGAILENDEQWIAALKQKSLPWEPSRCRQWALERFHYRVMASGYEKLYQKVVEGKKLNPIAPKTQDWRIP